MSKYINKTTSKLCTKIKKARTSYHGKLELAIKKIAKKYDDIVVSCVWNIQGTVDVQLDHNIFFKVQEKMEDEIRSLGSINDIYYREVN